MENGAKFLIKPMWLGELRKYLLLFFVGVNVTIYSLPPTFLGPRIWHPSLGFVQSDSIFSLVGFDGESKRWFVSCGWFATLRTSVRLVSILDIYTN